MMKFTHLQSWVFLCCHLCNDACSIPPLDMFAYCDLCGVFECCFFFGAKTMRGGASQSCCNSGNL